MVARILPPAALGVLGGGQLGRYFVLAAHELGYDAWVLDPDPDSPAGRVADEHLVAAYDDGAALDRLAAGCAAVTTEFEDPPAASLERLAAATVVRPSADAVAVCQDRSAERAFLARHGLPQGPHAVIAAADDLDGLPDELFPGILKSARLGYDGRGQVRVADREEAAAAFASLGSVRCVLERLLSLDVELSVVLARGVGGEVRCFPPSANTHRDGILDTSVVPAPVDPALAEAATAVAVRIAEALDYVGTMAVELFVSGGALLVNELAPRPHNSGHHTLDSCTTSQFEQQVRALCGLPLGDATPHSSAVMVNLLGDLWPAGGEPDWTALHEVAGCRLHLYGKRSARPGRKMGHATVVGTDAQAVAVAAAGVRAALGLPGAG